MVKDAFYLKENTNTFLYFPLTALLTDLVAKLQKVTRQFHRNVQHMDKEE